jgi:hypothetical protein
MYGKFKDPNNLCHSADESAIHLLAHCRYSHSAYLDRWQLAIHFVTEPTNLYEFKYEKHLLEQLNPYT